jgi:hypothetical protein
LSVFQYANTVACQCQGQGSAFLLFQSINLDARKGVSGRTFWNTEFTLQVFSYSTEIQTLLAISVVNIDPPL